MFRLMRDKKGQNTAEYAIVIVLVVAAAIAMQTYVKRGVQGRFKDGVDNLATKTPELGSTKEYQQYEPYYIDSSLVTQTVKEEKEQTGKVKSPTIKLGVSETDPNIAIKGTQEKTLLGVSNK